MSVVLVVFGFLATIILSSAIILNSWIKFADKQIDRRENRISQQKFIINLSSQIKQLNKNIALQKKSKNNNTIIDVECEIVEESNTQAKYLYLDNNH